MSNGLQWEIRRVMSDLDELWEAAQTADLDENARDQVSREIEEAAEALDRALWHFASQRR